MVVSLPTFKVHAWGTRALIFSSVFTAVYCIKLWQPRRQIELHQRNLILAVQDRNGTRIKNQLAENYSDRFGHTRDTAVSDLREVFRPFFVLNIRPQGTRMELESKTAVITTNLTFTGTGSGATEWITSEANRLTSPWTFRWEKESVWPWDWRLVNVDNSSLNQRDQP